MSKSEPYHAPECTCDRCKPAPLDAREVRKDLTDRECAKLIGALLGGLVQLADTATVRKAIAWWNENEAAWQVFEHLKAAKYEAARNLSRKLEKEKPKRGNTNEIQ